MTESSYWLLFDRAYRGDENDLQRDPHQRLVKMMEHLSLNDLIDYTKFFSKNMDALLTPGHLAAAFLLFEGTLGFDDFLSYLEVVVGVPRSTYLNVLKSPDAIFDFPVYKILLDLDGNPFATAGISVGEKKFGSKWAAESEEEFRTIEEIKPSSVHYRGKDGLDILTPELCRHLVPRFFERYSHACDWGNR